MGGRLCGGARSATPRPLRQVPPSIAGDLVVDCSTRGLNSVAMDGRSLDERAAHRTGPHTLDERKHLAKLRVAGSNPVFRSIVAAQGRFFRPIWMILLGPIAYASPGR